MSLWLLVGLFFGPFCFWVVEWPVWAHMRTCRKLKCQQVLMDNNIYEHSGPHHWDKNIRKKGKVAQNWCSLAVHTASTCTCEIINHAYQWFTIQSSSSSSCFLHIYLSVIPLLFFICPSPTSSLPPFLSYVSIKCCHMSKSNSHPVASVWTHAMNRVLVQLQALRQTSFLYLPLHVCLCMCARACTHSSKHT